MVYVCAQSISKNLIQCIVCVCVCVERNESEWLWHILNSKKKKKYRASIVHLLYFLFLYFIKYASMRVCKLIGI